MKFTLLPVVDELVRAEARADGVEQRRERDG
jgi:hypothetical protein